MLKQLLSPESIAVLGASRFPRKIGHEIVANLVAGGFKGEIVPVNPAGGDVLGLKCYKDLKEYGKPVDLCMIAVPREAVYEAMRHAMDCGVRAICIISAGFKEIGGEGGNLQDEILRLCSARGIRMLGPNCLGIMNTHNAMNATFARPMPRTGNISVISQSGGLCTAILDFAAERNLGLSMLVSMGNKADLDESDFLAAFAKDETTSVIVGYLEDVKTGPAFMKSAQKSSASKPVIILKAGTTEVGMKAAASHTGSIVGLDVAYDAAFRRAGIVRAECFEAVFDYAMAFATQPLPRGNRVAVVSNSGGPGVMAIDAVVRFGMKPASFGEDTISELKRVLPAAANIANPIDMVGDAGPDRFSVTIETVLKDEGVDAVVVIFLPQAITSSVAAAEVVAGFAGGDKPILASFMGGKDASGGRKRLVDAGIPEYSTPERAVEALCAMYKYAVWRQRPARVVPRLEADIKSVRKILADRPAGFLSHLSEPDSKRVLQAYGFPVPPGELAATADDAESIARRIGFPVALKIVSPDVLHKWDRAGVALNLKTGAEVQDAFRSTAARIGEGQPRARLAGALVEKMCAPGHELILGMKRDAKFGPVLMFGVGGVYVEAVRDVAFALAPVTEDEAVEMIRGTGGYRRLTHPRGGSPAYVADVARCLMRLGQLAMDFPEMAEIDVNPLVAGGEQGHPVAVDARIIMCRPVAETEG